MTVLAASVLRSFFSSPSHPVVGCQIFSLTPHLFPSPFHTIFPGGEGGKKKLKIPSRFERDGDDLKV